MPDVIIHNKLRQSVAVTILDETGAPAELKLAPNMPSDPLPVERVSQHAYEMAERGHIKIRPVV